MRYIILLLPLLSTVLFSRDISYNQDIRPILSRNCFACHGPDQNDRKAKLRLDTAEGAYASLKGAAPAIVPGDIDKSELVARILDDEDPMPPVDSHKQLKPEEKELLINWIKAGAVYSKPWAYEKPFKHPVPNVSNSDWPKNWIDHFILIKQEELNLKPLQDADSTTLIRRLHFDLTGLPPEWSVVEQFKSGKLSYEDLVEMLLKSPQFGERMAVYWLDLVRYADTVGYHGDQDHNISPYRDYVIRAFNLNIPFDQFTREQIAGDLLPESGKWQKVASGYNRLLQTSHEGGIQAKEYNAIYAADRVRNLSNVWMAATMGCSQCHDHKFDPYTIRDHYSMAAFFADLPDTGFSGNSLPTKRPPEIPFLSDQQEGEVLALKAKLRTLVGADKFNQIENLKSGNDKLSKVPKEHQAEWQSLSSQIIAIEKASRMTMVSVSSHEPRTMRILPRGNWLDDSGPVVMPSVPAFLGELPVTSKERANRLDLANWLVDEKDGVGLLTARVFANRIWYLFLGKGLSPSLEDFGGQGTPPTHPELLDNLALDFYSNNWDVKHLIRTIVHSRTYQLTSIPNTKVLEVDPSNVLYTRQNRNRLGAEFIRDNALAVSRLLEIQEVGGPSIKPYQPAGYYRHLNFPTRKYSHSTGISQYRRGLYVHWQRMFLHPMMKAMDAPSREECTAERPRSNTPTSALVLLNDPTFLEAAISFANRILQSAPANTEQRLQFAFRAALSRNPNLQEILTLQDLLEATRPYYAENSILIDQLLADSGNSHISKDIDRLELATWTAVARTILNLNETNNRN